jgi:hypothetical protein
MPPCRVEAVQWKHRRALRLSNGVIELTVLTGGGHIADLRLTSSPINALWESPWHTIEPQDFNAAKHAALYGEPAVGKMLSGYTGHAVALGYFGMPSKEHEVRGLALHGEAASSEWQLANMSVSANSSSLTLDVELPISELHFRRTLAIAADSHIISVEETITNRQAQPRDFQWVQHAAFGEPLLQPGASTLSLSADRALTWPLGYEGHELLPNNREFTWPMLDAHDLSQPFLKDGTGFVAAVRVNPARNDAYIAVHNRGLALAAGYVFDRQIFPWITLWEENCARAYPPWNGETRVRGVEFGTSPFPVGLAHAQQMRSLFDAPVLATIGAAQSLTTRYTMFVTPVPPSWPSVTDVTGDDDHLLLHAGNSGQLRL